jgi:hypothetical protein
MAGHAYLSYCRQDVAYVQRLVQHLAAAGLPVWVDQHLAEGARWQPSQEPAIQGAAVVLVVMSPAAEASDRVRGEILAAHRFGKPIVPLLLAGKAFFSQGASGAVDVTGGELPSDALVERLGQLCEVQIIRALLPDAPPRRRLRAPVIAIAAALLALVAASGVAIALSRPSDPASNPGLAATPVATLPAVGPTTTAPPSPTASPSARPSVTVSGSRKPSPTAKATSGGSTTNPAPPPFPTSLAVSAPDQVAVGDSITGTVTISSSYNSALKVYLASNPSGAVTVPAYVNIAPGDTSATFTIVGVAEGTTTVVATLSPLTATSSDITVIAAAA